MAMTKPKDPLDEAIEDAYEHGVLTGAGMSTENTLLVKKEAKQSILKHYISFDDVLELIGEDEIPVGLHLSTSGIGATERNKVRAELKAALKKRRSSNE